MKKKMYWFITVLASITLIFMLFEQILSVSLADSKAGITDSSAGANNTNKESLSSNLFKNKTDSTSFNNIAGDKNTKDYVDGEVLVKYKNDKINLDTSAGKVAALNVISAKSLETKEDLTKINTSLLKITDGKSVEDKVSELKNDPNVEYAEPNYKRHLSSISTNDPDRAKLWGLDNTGQTVNGVTGTADKDIDAPEAWAVNEGTNGTIIVAVIDSGVAYEHPDLSANMWDGTSCKDYNGNSLGACEHGYDFESNDKIPLPTSSSHGTHVAGTIAAAKNNSKGLIGVAPNAKIMAIKFGLDTTSEVKSIDFAIQNGAKVINASYGSYSYSQTEYDAINRFKTVGGIFVAAAGNGGADGVGDNNETSHFYPSDYTLDNIISVAATDQNDSLASFSNYGASSVDVGAPGTNIYSTYAESELLDETFEGVVTPAVPAGWTKAGTPNYWGTYNLGGVDKVLYGDVTNIPYANNVNSTITYSTINLSGLSGAVVGFDARCDTEYYNPYVGYGDYMSLESSPDGSTFTEVARWNEWNLDNDSNSGNTPPWQRIGLSVPDTDLTSSFKYRFKWYTDGTNIPVLNYDGCALDDVQVLGYTDGSDEGYAYSAGTSMAAPHVAGLAALIEGYKPALTYTQVKSLILTSGDDIPSLHGKTSAGTRINAKNALDAINPGYVLNGWGGVWPFGDAPSMSNQTHWINWDIAKDIALRSDGTSGYTLDGWGGIHPFGGAPSVSITGYWPGWDIARAIVLRDDNSGYVLNGWGGIWPFGGAPSMSNQTHWIGNDIARDIVLRSDKQGGYVLNKYGGIHHFGNAPDITNPSPVWWSGIARAIVLRDDTSGYVLNGWGGIHPFGGSPAISQQTHWIGWDIARDFDLRSDKTSGYVLNGWGGVHPFGGAPSIPNQTNWINWDIARAIKLVR